MLKKVIETKSSLCKITVEHFCCNGYYICCIIEILIMKAIELIDRSLIAISGEDKEEFLQGLITNDVNKLTESNSLFAALLTPQGKFS